MWYFVRSSCLHEKNTVESLGSGQLSERLFSRITGKNSP